MATLIIDAELEDRLTAQRRAWGADHHDEVWEGVYVMAPLPNDEHQELVADLLSIFQEVIKRPGLGTVRPGVNLAGDTENWRDDFRCPDVVVFLRDTKARNCDTHWRGGADFVVEIVSPGDRSLEKIPFYGRIGVRELLVIDRQPWRLELYRQQGGRLEKVAESGSVANDICTSAVIPLRFRLVPGEPRPRIEVTHVETGQCWTI
jgi:Uma2 family endonuclease